MKAAKLNISPGALPFLETATGDIRGSKRRHHSSSPLAALTPRQNTPHFIVTLILRTILFVETETKRASTASAPECNSAVSSSGAVTFQDRQRPMQLGRGACSAGMTSFAELALLSVHGARFF
jgi:hypothetical protein